MKLSADWYKHIKVISRGVLAFSSSDTLRDLTVTNCCVDAMKQQGDIITIWSICKWGSGVSTIKINYIEQDRALDDCFQYCFHYKGKKTLADVESASFFCILPARDFRSPGLQYVSSEIHVHVSCVASVCVCVN